MLRRNSSRFRASGRAWHVQTHQPLASSPSTTVRCEAIRTEDECALTWRRTSSRGASRGLTSEGRHGADSSVEPHRARNLLRHAGSARPRPQRRSAPLPDAIASASGLHRGGAGPRAWPYPAAGREPALWNEVTSALQSWRRRHRWPAADTATSPPLEGGAPSPGTQCTRGSSEVHPRQVCSFPSRLSDRRSLRFSYLGSLPAGLSIGAWKLMRSRG